ncbi:MAG: hypothetical protein PHI12_07410 [Dehalococcoidales bacterium]|nr:hypothetical protein [Dehalococcoidales bacterium]
MTKFILAWVILVLVIAISTSFVILGSRDFIKKYIEIKRRPNKKY